MLDNNIPLDLAADLRGLGYDAVHTREAGTQHEADAFHLEWAAERGRVVVTSDLSDFPRLAREWGLTKGSHAGIILTESASRLGYGELRRRLVALLDQRSADELIDQVLWLDASW